MVVAVANTATNNNCKTFLAQKNCAKKVFYIYEVRYTLKARQK